MQFDTLADSHQRRGVLTFNRFELTLSTAGPAPEAVHHGFGVLGGTIPIEDLYSGAQR